MSDRQDQIDELLDRWEAARDRGESLAPEDLCREHPELLNEIKHAIAALAWVPDVPQVDGPQSELISFTGSDGHGGRVGHEPVPKRLGRYELVEPLGAGGFGQVWKAYDPELRRHVAVKVPRADRGGSPSRIDRFLDEARRVAQLRHPGIVPVFDVGRQDDWCYMVSDLIEGESLQARIRREKMPWTEAARIAADVGDALQYAHEQGFIHRDVKPANILLDGAGKVYLADFGIAATEQELSTSGGGPSGTLAYMAPEQIQGGLLDGRADVYGLGVVLYEMLTGTRLFAQQEPAELRQAILHAELEPPATRTREIPAQLSLACIQALAKTPDLRYADARTFAQALRELACTRPGRKRRVVAAIAGVLVLTVVGVISLLGRGGGRYDPVEQPVPENNATTPGPAVTDAAAKVRPRRICAFDFSDVADRGKNTGILGTGAELGIIGKPEFTNSTDPDAPPAQLGIGVRFLNGRRNEALHAQKFWIQSEAWTISLWFRRRASENVDFLVYQGEWHGMGDERCPQFNVWVSPAGELRVLNCRSFREGHIDIDLTIAGIKAARWHHLAITFSAAGPASFTPGTVVAYLDGQEVGRRNNTYIGLSARNSKSALVIGSVFRPLENTNRCFDGVLADVEIFADALSAEQVAEKWQAGSRVPDAASSSARDEGPR